MKRLMGFFQSVLAEWRPHVEKPVSAEDVTAAMQAASIPTFGYFFMLAVAAAIATFGLLGNSAPAIIGAMIIAPLMAPIMSLAFGLISLNWRMIVTSILSVSSGVILVILFAFVSAQLIGLRIAGSEILGRTSPTLLDLGVAMAAGAAGAFAYTRKSIMNSIAGVAIAVALVPPLAVVGIGLAFGRKATGEGIGGLSDIGLYAGGFDIAQGAFVLFLTNLIGIVLVADIVFMFHRYGRWKQSLIGIAMLVGLTVLIFEPLNNALYRLYVKSAAMRTLTTLVSHKPELFVGSGRIDRLKVRYTGDWVYLDIDAVVPVESLEAMQERVNTFQKYLSAALNEHVLVNVDVITVNIDTFRASPIQVDKEVDEEVLKEIQ